MSTRVPAGFVDVQFKYQSSVDPEAMYTGIGLTLATDFETDAESVLDAINIYTVNMQPFTAVQYTIQGAEVTVGSADPEDLVLQMGDFVVGTGNSAFPQNSAFLVKKIGVVPGKRNRGRMYIPAVPNNASDASGAVSEPTLTELQDALNLAGADIAGLPGITSPVVFHGSAPYTPSAIAGLQLDGRLASQRRRMRP